MTRKLTDYFIACMFIFPCERQVLCNIYVFKSVILNFNLLPIQADEVEDEPDEYDCADPTSQPPSSPPTECSEEEVLEAADEDFNMETDYTQEESSAESLGSDEEGQDNSSTNTVT